jgi:hypothetical protein
MESELNEMPEFPKRRSLFREKMRERLGRASSFFGEKGRQAVFLVAPIVLAVVLQAQFSILNESTAVLVFALFFAARTLISKQSYYDAAFAALLVAAGAMILMPVLYGTGAGIVKAPGFERLFLYVVGLGCLFLGAVVFRDK